MKRTFDIARRAGMFFIAIFFVGQVAAQQVAYINTNNLPANGLQNSGGQAGQPFALGLEFTVNSAVVISQLGAYDATIGGSGLGFGSPVQVGIYSRASSSFISQTGIFSGTLGTVSNSYRFQSISALTLNPGIYLVIAAGYGIATAPDWNTQVAGISPSPIQFNGGGLLTLGSSFFDNNPGGQLQLTTVNVGGIGPQFAAGSFKFVPVPEPTTAELILASAILVGGLRFGRRFFGKTDHSRV